MRYHVLTKKGSKNVIAIGSKSEMCSLWGRLKYQTSPDEEYSVIPVMVSYDMELLKVEINEQIQYDYDKSHIPTKIGDSRMAELGGEG